MANYKSEFTGKQIDEAVGKALAMTGGYTRTITKPIFEYTIPAGEGYANIYDVQFEWFVEGAVIPVTVNGHAVTITVKKGGEEPLYGFDQYVSIRYRGWGYMLTAQDTEYGIDVNRHITIDIPVEEKVVHPVDPKCLPVGGVGYEEPAVMGKVFECTIPAGENGLYFDAPEGFSFVEGVPVTINGITIEADYAYANGGVHFQCGDYLSIEGTHEWNNEITGLMRVEAYDPNGQGIDVDRHITIDVDVVVKEPVVHTIEPKFLPGVCLPVVELSTELEYFGTSQILNEADQQKFVELATAMSPCVVKMLLHHANGQDYDIVGLMTFTKCLDYDGEYAHVLGGTNSTMSMMFVREVGCDGNKWIYRGESNA